MKLFERLSNLNRLALVVFAALIVIAAVFLTTGKTNASVAAAGNTPGLGGRTITVISTMAQAGTQVPVSIDLDSQGDEVAASFTLNFDPAIFSNPVVTLGSAAPANANLSVNANDAASGRLGILVDGINPFIVSPPNRQVILVTLTLAPAAPLGATPITFVTTPTPLSVSSAFGVLLPTVYQVGTVTITPPTVAFVTVSGRVTTPTGQNLRNAVVSLIDANNVRRIATTSSFGLYSFTNVPTGQTFTLTVGSKRYRFAPQVRSFTENTANVDFVGLE